jgi:hypothetical protein
VGEVRAACHASGSSSDSGRLSKAPWGALPLFSKNGRASFLDFNEDYSSMIMATLFAAALMCYVGILSWLSEA